MTGPRRWPMRLLIAGATLAVLLVVARLALPRLLAPQRIASLVAAQVSERTGREFAIRGALDYQLLPRIAVVAEDVTLANARWGSRPDMLRVRRASFQVGLWPLLHGEVQVDSVALDDVELLLETDAKGIGNWVLPALAQSGGEPSGEAGATSMGFAPQTLHLGAATLAYRDGATGKQSEVGLHKLDLHRNEQGHRIAGEASFNGQRWQIEGQLGPVEALIANRAEWPVRLAVKSAGAGMDVDAQILPGASPRAGRFALQARVDQAAALAPWVTQPARMPLPLELSGSFALRDAHVLQAERLRLGLAGQVLTGSATLRGGQRWNLQASLRADAIDLARWLPKQDAKHAVGVAATGAPRRRLFDDAPLPVDALRDGTAHVDLQIGRLQLPQQPPLSALKATVDLRPRSLTVEPLAFGLAGGQVRGKLTLSTAAAGAPQWSLKLDGSGMSPETLAGALGLGYRVNGGTVQLNTTLTLSGNTPHALAAGANGEVLVWVKDATLAQGSTAIGPNLLPRVLGAITPGRNTAAAPTTLQCAVLRLPLRNGVARIDRSIAVETPDLAISVSGQIDLRDETLALAFRPTPKAALGINTAQLASLVMAKGPIVEPALTLDPKGAAAMALSIGAAVASGGLSLLAQDLMRHSGDLHPCQTAATGVEAKEKAAPAGREGDAQAGRPEPQPALPGFLRKLFK